MITGMWDKRRFLIYAGLAGAAFHLSLLDLAFGQEHHLLRLKVPEERYTGVDMSSTLGSALDLELYTEDGTQVIESHIEHQSDEADLVMWWRLDYTHYKVDSIYGVCSWEHPPVQNSREWLEVKGKYKRSGGTGGAGATPTFWADVVAADLDVAHGGGDEVDETVEESQGAYFQACTNIPAKLTLRNLQYKDGIGADKRVELHKTHAFFGVHVYNDQALTQEITNWPVVTTHGALYNNPRYFYVTADTNSATARDMEFEARSFPLDTGGYASDRVRLTALKVESETIATTPADRTRTTIGVAEEVNLLATPSVGNITWSLIGGGGVNPTNGPTTTLTASSNAAVCSISCNINGISIVKEFTVLEPSGVISATINSTSHFSAGVAGARMHLYPVVVGPTNVSFYRVQCVEVGRDATNCVGYWVTNAAPSHVGNGADDWFPFDQANQWPPEWDHAGIWNVSSPWYEGGSFEWPIPAEWRIGQAGTTNSMVGWDQRFELESNGTVTIRKWGNWVARTTNDVITTN